MPTRLEELVSGRYRVSTPHGVKAKGTTLAKAKAQKRLLDALEHDPSFKPRGRRRTSGASGG